MDIAKKEFLTAIRDFMDRRRREVSSELELCLDAHIPEIIKSFQECMVPLLTEFFDAENRGEHGPLAWVYLSYLRSSALTHTESIRVDCYDERDRISDIETAENWDLAYVWTPFNTICSEMKNEFEHQTRVRGYELDIMIFDLAEYFYRLTRSFIKVILENWLKEYGGALLSGECVDFMMGEFMDRAEFVLRWDRDHIEWILKENREALWVEID